MPCDSLFEDVYNLKIITYDETNNETTKIKKKKEKKNSDNENKE